MVAFRLLLFCSIVFRICCQDFLEAAKTEVDGDKNEDKEDDKEDTKDKDNDADEEDKVPITDQNLKDVHAEWDVDGNKEASVTEMLDFAEKNHREVAVGEVDVGEILAEKDTNKDGSVSLDEHLADTTPAAGESGADDPKQRAQIIEDQTEMFKAADANSDGLLDNQELMELEAPDTNERLTSVQMKHSLRDADADGNGQLSFEEFKDSALVDASLKDLSDDATQMFDGRKDLFKRLDKNSDGHLQQEELRPLKSGRIDREDMVNEVVGSLDKNGNKQIDVGEVVQGKTAIHDSDLQAYLVLWAKKRQILSSNR